VLFGVGVLHVPRPNHDPTLKKGEFDVFPLVFVSADNIHVSTLLNTDLFIIQLFFFGKTVSALTLGSIALTNTNENLLGWIYFRGVGCFWVGGMKLADQDFLE